MNLHEINVLFITYPPPKAGCSLVPEIMYRGLHPVKAGKLPYDINCDGAT